jgi:hypothetical protein
MRGVQIIPDVFPELRDQMNKAASDHKVSDNIFHFTTGEAAHEIRKLLNTFGLYEKAVIKMPVGLICNILTENNDYKFVIVERIEIWKEPKFCDEFEIVVLKKVINTLNWKPYPASWYY